jgi:hypothetical protein
LSLLLIAFAWGVGLSAGPSRAVRVISAMFVAKFTPPDTPVAGDQRSPLGNFCPPQIISPLTRY